MSDIDLDEIIQLEDAAVAHLIPSYANEEDVERALKKSGMRVKELFYELDLRTEIVSAEEGAKTLIDILFGRFEYVLLSAIAHKAPVY